MEVEQLKLGNSPAMTFDEVSMERSKSFVKALQVFASPFSISFAKFEIRSGYCSVFASTILVV